jgi:hypothetical protein
MNNLNEKLTIGLIEPENGNAEMVKNLFEVNKEWIKEVSLMKEKTIPICILGREEEFKRFNGARSGLKNFNDFCKITINFKTPIK